MDSIQKDFDFFLFFCFFSCCFLGALLSSTFSGDHFYAPRPLLSACCPLIPCLLLLVRCSPNFLAGFAPFLFLLFFF
ncbi:hypothetical protein TCDM_01827 [Trypanosoma cruzi Dm28c]|uniref:Uncharacterized protein n=1 Tax=Trypanosoma cruzi Dm28c TaxID=1416333 RepID=V5BNE1_TRYCR|nr:hypothetical protein TCDM_01827 [Trypanosoma cruzi Dm28c]